MATITASLTLASPDLLTNALAFSTTNNLTTAGTISGISQTSGLARTNFTANPIQSKVIFRSDDATADKANKIYLKNLSTTVTEYFTIFIDEEEMGRLYAGDWAFFPWTATAGVKETFIVTPTVSSGAIAVGDSWTFDGITTTSTSAVLATFASQVAAQHYPNWTVTVSSVTVTFVARESVDTGTVVTVTADGVAVDLADSNFTMPITAAALGTATSSDIFVVPSVVTTMDLEHMLFKE
jgi:hypothetical protein